MWKPFLWCLSRWPLHGHYYIWTMNMWKYADVCVTMVDKHWHFPWFIWIWKCFRNVCHIMSVKRNLCILHGASRVRYLFWSNNLWSRESSLTTQKRVCLFRLKKIQTIKCLVLITTQCESENSLDIVVRYLNSLTASKGVIQSILQNKSLVAMIKDINH